MKNYITIEDYQNLRQKRVDDIQLTKWFKVIEYKGMLTLVRQFKRVYMFNPVALDSTEKIVNYFNECISYVMKGETIPNGIISKYK